MFVTDGAQDHNDLLMGYILHFSFLDLPLQKSPNEQRRNA